MAQKKLFFENENFDINLFAKTMSDIYDVYYGATTPYDMMVRGDKLLFDKRTKPLLSSLAKARQDILTSDREVAAFAATYDIFTQACG